MTNFGGRDLQLLQELWIQWLYPKVSFLVYAIKEKIFAARSHWPTIKVLTVNALTKSKYGICIALSSRSIAMYRGTDLWGRTDPCLARVVPARFKNRCRRV
jgi:hypothetical protein